MAAPLEDASSPPGSWVPRFLRFKPPSTDDSIPDERTSLLPRTGSEIDSSEKLSLWAGEILSELWLLLKMSVPVILAYTLQNSLQTVSVLVVGRLSPEDLAAAAFSYMFAMCTAWLIALGGTTALDTLCSTSFTGSKNPHELGILLQRAFVVLGGMYIPVCVLWWFSEGLFLKLGQERGISRDSAVFLRCLIPGGLGYIYFEATKKYLQAQGIMRAGTYVLLFTSPLSAVLNYLFVYKLGFGLIGAPIATGITYWVSFGCLFAYALFVQGYDRWGGWDRACLKNISVFAKLAGMGVIMVGTEWVCHLPPCP
jgi:MATE family multidrug resistance protein